MAASSHPDSLSRSNEGAAAEPTSSSVPLLEHEYDGIREYDNPMPRWWVLTFWASFVFSLGYLFHYHASNRGLSVAEDYEKEMSEAREERARRAFGETVSEQGLGQVMQDPRLLADAKLLFAARCASCHADRGQGLIGPNLTDPFWIHGRGSLMDIYKVVSAGVPEKGMPSWETQLTSIERQKLAALLGSFRGQNLAGKPPQGSQIPAP